MPLVLVENERTAGGRYDAWQDLTGQRYHFPNAYRLMVREGEEFVYYRGVRASGGRRRAHPEYFGYGRIGRVWPDPANDESAPKRTRSWFCEISDFQRFASPVPWKRDGLTIEEIPRNLFGNGVRRISQAVLDEILVLASLLDGNSSYLTKQGEITIDRRSLGRDGSPTPRQTIVTSRIVRDSRLARALKELHGNRCQICGDTLLLPDGTKYSEAHHIRPLGQPHNGPDVAANLLVVCPNHHALCDLGGITLDLSMLCHHPGHVISDDSVTYHNSVVLMAGSACCSNTGSHS
ncbi:HNH endonuclease [Longimicrobium sp.]|jgi:hypothetical protein|uniref:HNH endonuclease n=1 Tax=Longimicrobium sp. TaxID=2029185 RepID=UPI002EDA50A1